MSARRDIDLAARLAGLPDGALASPNEAAAFLGFAPVTLRMWRRQGRGPAFVLIEGRPRYRMADLRGFAAGQMAA